MQERRKFVRIPENSPISYEIIHETKTGAFITKDISQGGIRFFVHEFVSKDTILKIRLTIEKISFSFETFVKVMWVREDPRSERYEIGVEFMNIPPQARSFLVSYIKSALQYSGG